MVDREEFEIKVPERLPRAFRYFDGDGVDAVLGELARHERERELRADQGDVPALAQQVRHRADVILVGVGEDERVDRAEPVPDVVEVRQDQVDAWLVGFWEEDAAVHDQRPAPGPAQRPAPAALTATANRPEADA